MVCSPEGRTAEVEVTAVRIACIDAEVPIARRPVERTVEIGSVKERPVLPVEQYVTQVEVAPCPVITVEVIGRGYSHEIVEVHLITSLILFLGQIQFVCHLVGQEQRLLTCLFVTHCL